MKIVEHPLGQEDNRRLWSTYFWREILAVALFWGALVPAHSGELSVGRASIVITPSVGMPMAGSYSLRISQGIRDNLRAKALVLEKDGVKAALVACDLISVSDSIVAQARRLIEENTDISGTNVMISATHTHSGPFMPGRASFDEQFSGGIELVEEFEDQLPEQIAESVRLANYDLTPARTYAGVGSESSVVFNRRYLMKDGSVRTNPGRLNPDIVRPVGPVDSDLAVVYFTDESAEPPRPLATYINYPLHVAVVGGRHFSADFPGVMASLLGQVKGIEMLTLFTAGACGNVNHLNVKIGERRSGPTEAARIGRILSAEVLKTYDRLDEIEPGPLQVRRRVVALPTLEVSPDQVEAARALIARFGTPDHPGTRPLAEAFKILDVAARQGKPFKKEIQVITLGDQLAWVSLPGEIFVELGMLLKNASPFRHTIVAELSNGWISYVPDRKAYPEGSYEVLSARCGPGCGETMVDAAVDMLIELHSKTLPRTELSLKR